MNAPRDLFELLCHQAAGQPIPPLPDIPGRAYVQRVNTRDMSDPFAEAFDRLTTHNAVSRCAPTPEPEANPQPQPDHYASTNAGQPAGASP